MRVIASDDDDKSNASDDGSSPSENDGQSKPRRRTYRKKADASGENDGVMSTLARGRSDDSSEPGSREDSEGASQTEAAE